VPAPWPRCSRRDRGYRLLVLCFATPRGEPCRSRSGTCGRAASSRARDPNFGWVQRTLGDMHRWMGGGAGRRIAALRCGRQPGDSASLGELSAARRYGPLGAVSAKVDTSLANSDTLSCFARAVMSGAPGNGVENGRGGAAESIGTCVALCCRPDDGVEVDIAVSRTSAGSVNFADQPADQSGLNRTDVATGTRRPRATSITSWQCARRVRRRDPYGLKATDHDVPPWRLLTAFSNATAQDSSGRQRRQPPPPGWCRPAGWCQRRFGQLI
jgi:hypothetical protein